MNENKTPDERTYTWLWPYIAELIPPGRHRILHLDCGLGAMAALATKVGHRVTGIDASPATIQLAAETWPEINFRVGSYFDDLGGPYDVVIAPALLEHAHSPQDGIASVVRAVRHGGSVILATSYRGYMESLALSLTGKRREARVFTRGDLRRMLTTAGCDRRVIFKTVGPWKAMICAATRS